MIKYCLVLSLMFASFISCELPEHYHEPPPVCTSKVSETDPAVQLTEQVQMTRREEIREQKPSVYRYFFETFLHEAGKTYLVTNFRNDGACFNIKMLVEKLGKLKGMHRTNGVSYPTELFDLTWELRQVAGEEEVVFIDMHKIID